MIPQGFFGFISLEHLKTLKVNVEVVGRSKVSDE
jgi:hypothetical protein